MNKYIKVVAVILSVVAAVALVAQTATAKDRPGDSKPGWGNGDENHIHTGPPGQSVHPGDDEDENHDTSDHDTNNGHDENEHGLNNHGKNHDD